MSITWVMGSRGWWVQGVEESLKFSLSSCSFLFLLSFLYFLSNFLDSLIPSALLFSLADRKPPCLNIGVTCPDLEELMDHGKVAYFILHPSATMFKFRSFLDFSFFLLIVPLFWMIFFTYIIVSYLLNLDLQVLVILRGSFRFYFNKCRSVTFNFVLLVYSFFPQFFIY